MNRLPVHRQLISIKRRSPHGRVPRRTMDGFGVVWFVSCVACTCVGDWWRLVRFDHRTIWADFCRFYLCIDIVFICVWSKPLFNKNFALHAFLIISGSASLLARQRCCLCSHVLPWSKLIHGLHTWHPRCCEDWPSNGCKWHLLCTVWGQNTCQSLDHWKLQDFRSGDMPLEEEIGLVSAALLVMGAMCDSILNIFWSFYEWNWCIALTRLHQQWSHE